MPWQVDVLTLRGSTGPRRRSKPVFLHLARVKHVAAETHNQAYDAILCFYRHVLDLPDLTRSHRDTKPELRAVFVTPWLCVSKRKKEQLTQHLVARDGKLIVSVTNRGGVLRSALASVMTQNNWRDRLTAS